MANLSWVDLVLRHIPEGFIIILAGYAVSKKPVNAKLYILSSILLGVVNFAIRFLPISSIFHMVLSIIVAITILLLINNIKTLHAILSTILAFMLSIISEAINLLILSEVFRLDTETVFQNSTPLAKNLYGLPSLVLFALIVLVYYLIFGKKKKNANNKNIK